MIMLCILLTIKLITIACVALKCVFFIVREVEKLLIRINKINDRKKDLTHKTHLFN